MQKKNHRHNRLSPPPQALDVSFFFFLPDYFVSGEIINKVIKLTLTIVSIKIFHTILKIEILQNVFQSVPTG